MVASVGNGCWVGLGTLARYINGDDVISAARMMNARWPANVAEYKGAMINM